MKKIMFVLFSSALSLAVISASAQTDSTRRNSPSNMPSSPSTQPSPSTPSQAPSQTPSQSEQYGQDKKSNQSQGDRVQVKQGELPQSVRDAIMNDKNQAYSGWQIGTAYRNTKDNTYSVELKKGSETKTVKFDARGNKVGNDE